MGSALRVEGALEVGRFRDCYRSAKVSIVDFVERKIVVAQALDRGECGGSYAEACIIMASVISGIASDLWPGKGLDRKRFVELWARYADPALSPNLISVPLL